MKCKWVVLKGTSECEPEWFDNESAANLRANEVIRDGESAVAYVTEVKRGYRRSVEQDEVK